MLDLVVLHVPIALFQLHFSTVRLTNLHYNTTIMPGKYRLSYCAQSWVAVIGGCVQDRGQSVSAASAMASKTLACSHSVPVACRVVILILISAHALTLALAVAVKLKFLTHFRALSPSGIIFALNLMI
jgi:hypothetical protein